MGGIHTTLLSLVLISFSFEVKKVVLPLGICGPHLAHTYLIFPYLTVALAEAQVLPIDSANCRVTIWSPGLIGMGSWSKEPRNNEFVESGL